MTAEFRYRPGNPDENAVLRLALWEAWGYRCYWCRQPRDFSVIDIDHIIPQKEGTQAVDAGLLRQYVTTDTQAQDFELHAVYNLGPICRGCNVEKSDALFAGAPRFMSVLDKARWLWPRVETLVRSFRRANVVTKAMLAVSIADLSDPGSKQALMELGPLVVNRLRSIAPDVLSAPSNYDFSDADLDDFQRVSVTLDEPSRRAKVILEDVYDSNVDDALRACVRALVEAIEKHLQNDIYHQFEERGHLYPDVGEVAGRILIEIDKLAFDAGDRTFAIGGRFEADGSAMVGVVAPQTDSGTAWPQGYADVEGSFRVPFWPDILEALGVEVGDVEIDPGAGNSGQDR